MAKNFLSGEVSVSQLSANEQKYYQSAVKKADGFVVTPEGGLTACLVQFIPRIRRVKTK